MIIKELPKVKKGPQAASKKIGFDNVTRLCRA